MTFRTLVLAAFVFTLGCSHSAPTGPIVVGHLLPGQNDDEFHAVSMAVEAINADPAALLLGRKLKVIHADAGSTPDEAQGQTARLLTVDKVDAVIGTNRWAQAEKMALAAQSPLVIALSLNGYAGAPASAPLFPVGIAPAEQGRALCRYIKESLKGTKAVVLKEADAVIPGLIAKAFVQHFGSGAVEMSLKAAEAPDTLKDLGKPDAIVLCGSAKAVVNWRSKLPDAPLLFGGEEADTPLLQVESKAARPFFAVVSFLPADETPAAKEFVRKFQDQFGKPPTVSAALAHDAVVVWTEAVRRANSLETDKIRQQLTKKDASFGVLTGQLSYAADQSPRRPLFIVRYAGLESSLVIRYEP
jgi:branched-chain amino acid transport system substrate-binding protein